jgi:DNA ligase (NAD+)
MRVVTKEELERYQIVYSRGNPLISDEEYDALLEEYLKENGEENRPFLRAQQSDDVNDIVGTLTKAYGVTEPWREGQMFYAKWQKKISPDAKIILQPKFDGCSIACDLVTGRWYTRGDYDNGESVDVTELFEDRLTNYRTYVGNSFTAIKFEAIMAKEVYDKLNLKTSYKRPRDVVSGAITSRDIEMCKYITLVPLRVYGDNHQYIPSQLNQISIELSADDFDGIQAFINDKLADGAVVKFNLGTYAIDGVVVSVIEDNHTTDEIAIKILNNIKETKIINIDYQYGKTGKITPVGILDPVKFDTVTVDHVGLSTLDRVMELGLKYNDTVRIVYNIVPYLLDTYNDGTIPIPIPKNCPICGSPLNFKTLKTVRCTNPQCKGLKIGMINRYCEKMKMMGVSKGILTKLFEAGLIESIGDLYRLTPEKIMSLDGFKEKSANNIINSIRKASDDVPLSRWMGALPIKDISAKTWQLVIDARYPMDELKASNAYRNAIQNGTPDSFMTECIPNYVYGFSTNTYAAMREGLVLYWDEIQDVIQYINFKCTTNITKPIKGRVTLTGTRDGKLISYLIEKGYDVNDYSSKTIALIIPQKGYVSSKVVKAKKMGIPVYTIEEAYEAL